VTSSLARKKLARVHIGNPTAFRQKVQQLVSGGPDKLQVITDYDKTLTTEASHSSWDMLERGGLLSPSYENATRELAKKYHPIEIDPLLSTEEKTSAMVAWWSAAHELLVAEKLSRSQLTAKMESLDSQVVLRTGYEKFFALLAARKVPVLILSAGIGDLIESALAGKNLAQYNHVNVHIISNFFQYESSGIVTGFKGEMIHVFNKNEVVVKETPHYASIAARGNVLLMGDSLGDLRMADGVPHECVLTVGFLHTTHHDKAQVDALLAEYKRRFDVVLVDTDSLEYVHDLLREVCK
jgi:5'-nucleotidase